MTHPDRATLPLRHRLRHDHFLHLDRPPVLRLQAECGTLWVTVDGDSDDIQIEAGQSRVFDGRAPVTIGTLGGDAVFSATPLSPQRRRWWQGLGAWLGQPVQGMLR